MKPMLATSVGLDEVEAYLRDDRFVAQQKLDGDRTMVRVRDGEVLILNRNGILRTNPFPRKIRDQFRGLQGDWCFDGELLDELWLFDLPLAGGAVLPTHPYSFRLNVLEQFFSRWSPSASVRLLPTSRTAPGKARLLERILAQDGEGVVFKHHDATYRPGKRSTQMLKAKFTKTADCVVTAVRRDGRDNCHIGLFDQGRLVEVGSLAMLGKPSVAVGDVVEVKYLYASEANLLVQPALLRIRYDKPATQCTLDQLVYTSRSVILMEGCYDRYVRQRRRAKATDTEVSVLDCQHPDSECDSANGRWLTECEHRRGQHHATLRAARAASSHPEVWCPQCLVAGARAA